MLHKGLPEKPFAYRVHTWRLPYFFITHNSTQTCDRFLNLVSEYCAFLKAHGQHYPKTLNLYIFPCSQKGIRSISAPNPKSVIFVPQSTQAPFFEIFDFFFSNNFLIEFAIKRVIHNFNQLRTVCMAAVEVRSRARKRSCSSISISGSVRHTWYVIAGTILYITELPCDLSLLPLFALRLLGVTKLYLKIVAFRAG